MNLPKCTILDSSPMTRGGIYLRITHRQDEVSIEDDECQQHLSPRNISTIVDLLCTLGQGRLREWYPKCRPVHYPWNPRTPDYGVKTNFVRTQNKGTASKSKDIETPVIDQQIFDESFTTRNFGRNSTSCVY